MKKILGFTFACLVSIGCGTAQQTQPPANTNAAAQASNQTANGSAIISSHSSDTTKPNSPPNASTESPMARPIDTSALTAAVERAEKEYKKNPRTKETLAKAYFERAFALTDAAQYRAALGDFRRGLKLSPNNEDAKAMNDRIISIFNEYKREPPKEGEEPAPLPFKK